MSLIRELAIAIPIFLIVTIIASQLVVVPTASMTPTIKQGDMVIVEKTNVLDMIKELNPENIKTGDVIVYEKNSTGGIENIIHRVVAVNESEGQKYYILKGDNNTIEDQGKVLPDQVMAKAVSWNGKPITIPQVGWILLWLKGSTNQ